MKVPEPKKLPSGNYFIQLRLNGKSVPITAVTAKECKKQAELIKAEYQAGRRVEGVYGEKISLADAIDRYIDKRSNVLSPSTIRGYKAIKRNYFQDEMPKLIDGRINWQAAINREAKRLAPKTLRNAWLFITSVLKENNITPPNVKLPQAVPTEKQFLDPDQIRVFVAAVKGQPCEIPSLLALHSLRRSEIMALTWDKIDLKQNTIRVSGAAVFDANGVLVRKATNKNDSSVRTLPIMIPGLYAALEAVEDKSGLVVRCHANTLWEQINKVCEDNGLPKVGVHGLRHSFASLAYHLGLSELETMQLGGWSDTKTMRDIYTHISAKDRLKSENKIAAFFKNANEYANEY